MSNSQDQGPSVHLLAGLLLIAGLGGFFFYNPPFEGSRPTSNDIQLPSALGPEDVPARLWQDPLWAVSEYHLKQSGGAGPDSSTEDSIAELARQILARGDAQRQIIVMPVMVSGSSYAEDMEQRRRRRYAILSALGAAGYAPSDAEHIGYFQTRWPQHLTAESPLHRSDCSSENSQTSSATDSALFVPYEWFGADKAVYQNLEFKIASERSEAQPRRASERAPVLVMWLSENMFADNPLARLARLFKTIDCSVPEATDSLPRMEDIKVIGPAGSPALAAMVREAQDEQTREETRRSLVAISPQRKIEIYSPFATASARLLAHKLDPKPYAPDEKSGQAAYRELYPGCENSITPVYSTEGELEQAFANAHVRFFRTITSDKNLAKSILCKELDYRGIDVKDKRDVIVLLAEWDTFYGRSLPATFEDVLLDERHCPLDKDSQLHYEHCRCGVCRYSYLRGLDGELPPIANSQTTNIKSKQGISALSSNAESIERPVGDSQFDYLRQLTYRIERDVDRIGNVNAVGVLGSDVYDKLLVLQALRPYFPKAIYFTTDLDSRYFHPANYQWARNLVVASGFGLELYADRQALVPPFRDSYQTAAFLSAELAVDPNAQARQQLQAELKAGLQPQMFEIGRNEPVALSMDNSLASSSFKGSLKQLSARLKSRLPTSKDATISDMGLFAIDPHMPIYPTPVRGLTRAQEDLILKTGLVVIFVVGLVVFMFRPLRSRSFIAAGASLVLTPAVVISALVLLQPDGGEPFSLTAGVSIWPTEAIRLFAFILGVLLIIYGSASLQRNAVKLSRRYRLRPTIVCGDDGRPTNLRALLRKSAMPVWPNVVQSVQQLWACYLERQPRHRRRAFWRMPRFWRVVPVIVVYAAVFGYIEILEADVPFRGIFSLVADRISLGLAIAAFASLLFYVIDATRLAEQFIERLTATRGKWPAASLRKFAQLRGISVPSQSAAGDKKRATDPGTTAGLTDWLAIQLIADRTHAVTNLIYYPFIILLLLIVSYHSWFDRWTLSPVLILVFVVHAALAVACTITLRRTAERGRRKALARMRQALSIALGADQRPQADQLRLLIEEVEKIQEGAFCPISQQPVLKAVLLPFGGAGGLLALEYLITG